MASSESRPKIQQPTPQALPTRPGPTAILVSPRQKGNPILKHITALPWEYSDDIPADFVLGQTTCALFLSLKYHRLHPEYIYGRIRELAGKYNLRLVLTMVDVDNHEAALKALSKTSLVNNVTIVLCWSAQEAGHYVELYKMYEHAQPTSIKAHQATGYSDRLIEFITVPRSVNKTDAVGLISNFGSLRTAVNARPEEVALIAGWGEKKVQRWCNSVREPFRLKQAAKRGLVREDGGASAPVGRRTGGPGTFGIEETENLPSNAIDVDTVGLESEEAALREVEAQRKRLEAERNAESSRVENERVKAAKKRPAEEQLDDGVMAALAKLRNQ
ncbi:mating-type switching protein swi10 [Eremomyces bilateralis CBS 781.70]|uniref:Mating-type switching protein swi10 n=1 Tax=Eremomyces bilateralis CBS 781.70 TaxID=1392243 RepID=A0A6G1GGZ5_9PEZI|nr:mating-type switching protein swi10 [Eremomyces bilateralis CBS 781.70]KAF1817262.1 mating-type switching protein swi10 [Eremomyces bilateralis CBS 781.70]